MQVAIQWILPFESSIDVMFEGMSWHFFFMMDFINPKTGRKACPEVDTVFFGLICYSECPSGSLIELYSSIRKH